jgi:hypothetical protein
MPPKADTEYWVANNNWTKEILGTGTYTDESQVSAINYLINVDSTTNPALGCDKGFEATFQCGKYTNVTKNISMNPEVMGKTARFDCEAEAAVCAPLKLTLEDDGSLTLTNTETNSTLWSSEEIADKRDPPEAAAALDEYKAALGKYPRNYLMPGEFLDISGNEWIGSPSGKYRLMMSSNGLQVVYNDFGCMKLMGMGATDGGSQRDEVENTATLLYLLPDTFIEHIGKLGYVNDAGQLQLYSPYSQQYVNSYETIGNYSVIGGTLGTPTGTTNADACQLECNSTPDCVGFIYDTERSMCELKDKSVYQMPRIIKESAQYQLRNKGVNVDASCPTGVAVEDTSFWENTTLSDTEMDSTSQCGLALFTKDERIDVAKKQTPLTASVTGDFSSSVNTLFEKYNTLKNRLLSTKADTADAKNTLVNKENTLGDWNYKKYDQLKAMSEDTDLIMMSQNYRHIMWSILAIVIIIATMKIAK